MFWRTFATTVVLFMVAAATVAAHDSVSDRATLTLQGTVAYHANVSIRASEEARVVEAMTNTPGGLSLSVELASGDRDGVLTINDLPVALENGCAHVADVQPGVWSDEDRPVAIAYAGSTASLMVLDVSAR